jgi:all-trans-retinol 13,14-reductase
LTRTSTRAVVVGSGIGGLSCACMLAGEGLDTILLEKKKRAGGTAGGFTYRGIDLELGCNVSGPAGEGKSLTRLLRYFGVAGHAGICMLPPEACVHVVDGGEVIPLPAGIEAYAAAVAERYPADRDEILGFGRRVRAMTDGLPLFNMDRYFELARDVETRLMAPDTLLGGLSGVRSPGARRLLSLFWRFIGTPPADCSMSLYGPEMGAFLEGPCTLRGADLMEGFAAAFEAAGGRLRTASKVTRILVRNGETAGVELAGGEMIESDLVVSAIHPLETLDLLEDPHPARRMRRRLEQAGETCGTFVSYFTRADRTGDGRRPTAWYQILDGCDDDDCGPGPDPAAAGNMDIGFLDARDPSPSGPVARAIVLVSPGAFDTWKGTKTRRRGEDYEAAKAALAARILETIRARLPGIAPDLEHLVSATPLTLRDELGHRGGAFGILRSARLRGLATCSWKTPIRGLFLGGHSVLYPGITGTLETTFLIGAEIFGAGHMVSRCSNAP